MGERVAVDRSHVHPKGVRVRKSTVMVHGCEPNCPAVLLFIFKLFSCVVVWLMVLMVQRHVASPKFGGFTVLSKEEHWLCTMLSGHT